MGWLTNWDDAAKQPRRVLALMFLCGLLGGGAIGYFRFDRSLGWAMILGLSVGAILSYVGWKAMHESAADRRQRSRKAALGLAKLFSVIPIALIAGAAANSEHVFVVVFAVGVALTLTLRYVLR